MGTITIKEISVKFIFNYLISYLQNVVNYAILHKVQPSAKYTNKQY